MNNLLSSLSRSKSFRTLMDFAEHASDGIAFMDVNGTICFVNGLWAKMHGYAATNELTDKNICLFYPPRQLKSGVFSRIEEARQNGIVEASLDNIRSDGAIFQTLTRIVALNNAVGENLGFVIFATDISEHNRLEQSLIRLERTNQHLQKQLEQVCRIERAITEKAGAVKGKNDESDDEAIPIREIPPFDPRKLKALADLAKRLAKKEQTAASSGAVEINT